MHRSELIRRVDGIHWYHQMDLGQGIRTPGVNNPALTLPRLHLPELTGRSVLDIGAWDGFYSLEAERRGSARVLATDSFSWGGAGWGSKEGFNLAREALRSEVEDRTIDVMELSPQAVGTFDVVLFLGVLYHLRDPMTALERVASVTSNQLILETEVDMLLTRRPAAAVYPNRELNNDPTNWFGFNPPAVLALLKSCGFRRAEVVWSRTAMSRLAGWVKHLPRSSGRRSLTDSLQRNLVVPNDVWSRS